MVKRSSPLTRKTRLSPMSAKRKRENAERRAVILEMDRERGPLCEGNGFSPLCTGFWRDAHELVRRSQGGSITDPSGMVLLCRACHRHVHDNPALARAAGLLKSGWEPTGDDLAAETE